MCELAFLLPVRIHCGFFLLLAFLVIISQFVILGALLYDVKVCSVQANIKIYKGVGYIIISNILYIASNFCPDHLCE